MQVKLIAKTVYTEDQTRSMEELAIWIARVSSDREDKFEEYTKLLNYLVRNRHWSSLEHCYMTFEIQTSRAIGRQLLRHRSFTFQELSQRYHEGAIIENIELRAKNKSNRQSSTETVARIYAKENTLEFEADDYTVLASKTTDLLSDVLKLYDELVASGIAPETARMILPECTQTTLYMTGNLRSWIHFLAVRDDEHAQLEIIQIARQIKEIFSKENPHLAQALGYTNP